jgi:hypothetical protein
MKFELPKKFILPKMPGNVGLPKKLSLDLRMGEASRYFSGSVFEKAMVSLDKITLWIVCVTWVVALAAMGGAYMAVKTAGGLKIQAEAARAQEPPVPVISRLPLNKEQYIPLVDRVKKQFPGLTYEITNKPSLRITSINGDMFNGWLNAIGYTDSMVPTIRWNMVMFCAGTECPGEGLMQSELVAETINISHAGDEAPAAATPAATATPAAK